jgi:hypothetical protein
MSKKTLLKRIFIENQKADKWLDTVPPQINSMFFDNPYINSHQKVVDLCINHIFSENEEQTWAYWFLYDWGNNHSLTICIDDKEYSFGDADKLLDFMFSQHLIEEYQQTHLVKEIADYVRETRWMVPPTQEQIAEGIESNFGVK